MESQLWLEIWSLDPQTVLSVQKQRTGSIRSEMLFRGENSIIQKFINHLLDPISSYLISSEQSLHLHVFLHVQPDLGEPSCDWFCSLWLICPHSNIISQSFAERVQKWIGKLYMTLHLAFVFPSSLNNCWMVKKIRLAMNKHQMQNMLSSHSPYVGCFMYIVTPTK